MATAETITECPMCGAPAEKLYIVAMEEVRYGVKDLKIEGENEEMIAKGRMTGKGNIADASHFLECEECSLVITFEELNEIETAG